MLLTGCTINGRLDHMTFINAVDGDAELGFISGDDDSDDDEVLNADSEDTVKKVFMPSIDRK